ncbi:TRAP transporter small permease subunit [Burkholderiaceae bacterium FT117]|uniref:TRAP transporter small permease subunit n=1 Tax=Zeimonas sediminis TaxID=2944268 RepID=UPI002342F239|nr:TRAP transporter small permease subunit [Zeimonas sediminis]MCM5571131.1 TRAP transporter small permease subunit [Zeimonas sediminis]
MNAFNASLERVVLALGWVARASVLALVLLVAANVLLRYAFSWSPVGLQEFEWHLVSPIALLGMAYAVHHRADVRVDFLYDGFGERGRALVDVASGLLTLAVGVAIAWLAIPYVMQAYEIGEGSPDPGGLPLRFLLKAFIPLGFSALALQGLVDTLRAVSRLLAVAQAAVPAKAPARVHA